MELNTVPSLWGLIINIGRMRIECLDILIWNIDIDMGSVTVPINQNFWRCGSWCTLSFRCNNSSDLIGVYLRELINKVTNSRPASFKINWTLWNGQISALISTDTVNFNLDLWPVLTICLVIILIFTSWSIFKLTSECRFSTDR